jgi:SAM-dependent methyltransferase
MAMMDTDRDWEVFAATDPYWAVLTDDRFRGQPDEHALATFFESGEAHVAIVFQTIHRHLDARFTPVSCLDFGCGVGRLVIPFARRCHAVIGVDVAESMLQKARERCAVLGLDNATFVRGDDELSRVHGCFDLIHSFIVFQHIPCDRGLRLVAALLRRLTDGGVGVLHITYATTSRHPPPRRGAMRSTLSFMARSARGFLKRMRGEVAARQAVRPVMQMNSYDLNAVLLLLQEAGVRRTWLEFTDHGGEYGVMLYFQKPGTGNVVA